MRRDLCAHGCGDAPLSDLRELGCLLLISSCACALVRRNFRFTGRSEAPYPAVGFRAGHVAANEQYDGRCFRRPDAALSRPIRSMSMTEMADTPTQPAHHRFLPIDSRKVFINPFPNRK